MAGAWPPSSIVTRFMCAPASAARCLPTATEPVNDILRITGCGMRYSEISDGTPKTRLTTPGRQARIDKGLHQPHHRARRVLRPLDDDRAAGRHRARDLPHRLVDREIPRREGRDRPHRLLHHELLHAVGARRHDAAVGAPRLLGEPVDDVGAGQGLEPRLEQRLALLHRHGLGDRVGAARADCRRPCASACSGHAPTPCATRQSPWPPPPARGRDRRVSACGTVPIASPVAGLSTGSDLPRAPLPQAPSIWRKSPDNSSPASAVFLVGCRQRRDRTKGDGDGQEAQAPRRRRAS